MVQKLSVATAPKTSTFQARINPEIKAEVESIYRNYILYVLENYLNEKLFKGFLKQLLSMQRESQSAGQTNYNTMVAMELLKDGD